jgi:hypothetical protein
MIFEAYYAITVAGFLYFVHYFILQKTHFRTLDPLLWGIPTQLGPLEGVSTKHCCSPVQAVTVRSQ